MARPATDFYGFIYLMRIKRTDLYKVGISKNPKNRLKDLQQKMDRDLEIMHTRRVFFTYFFEQRLHKIFKRRNVVFTMSGREFFEFYLCNTPVLFINLVALVSYLLVIFIGGMLLLFIVMILMVPFL